MMLPWMLPNSVVLGTLVAVELLLNVAMFLPAMLRHGVELPIQPAALLDVALLLNNGLLDRRAALHKALCCTSPCFSSAWCTNCG